MTSAVKSFELTVMKSGSTRKVVVSAKDMAQAKAKGAQMGQVLSVKTLSSHSLGRKMSLADRLVFFQRLASMISSRVGTSEALNIIYQSFSGKPREAARILRDQIEGGASLPQAMEAAGPKYFPDAVVAIVSTGAKGGDLGYALREAARFEKELAITKKSSGKGLWKALGSFFMGIGVVIGSTLYIMPMMMESELMKGASDDIDVGWLLTISTWMNWFAVAAITISIMVAILMLVVRPIIPGKVDNLILKVPVYRDLAMAKSNYMVFFGMAVLLKAGLRVEEALRLTIESAPKGGLRDDLTNALNALVKGSREPWPMHMKMLHPTDKASLATSQNRQQTASTIEDLALQYQMLYQSRLESVVPFLEVFSALFLSLAGFVLFGVTTIPLLQMTTSLLGT